MGTKPEGETESNEDVYYDKETVKLDCLDCEQGLHSREMFNSIRRNIRERFLWN